MLRAVLVGLLSVSALACKSGGDAPKSQPGVAAGKVVDVTGTVTVRHAGVARPLANGDTVEGDDTIETGADGNVIIELSHNLARWELGANRSAKVSASAAWNLPKKSGDTAAVEQDTAAAGRPAERSAAETAVSASREREEAAAESAPAPAPAMAPAAATPAPPPPPAPRKLEGRGDASAATAGDAPDGRADAPRVAAPEVAAREVVLRSRGTLEACLRDDVPAVSVRIAIDVTGKATTIVKGKTQVPDAVKSCMRAAVGKLRFAHAPAAITVDVSR